MATKLINKKINDKIDITTNILFDFYKLLGFRLIDY